MIQPTTTAWFYRPQLLSCVAFDARILINPPTTTIGDLYLPMLDLMSMFLNRWRYDHLLNPTIAR